MPNLKRPRAGNLHAAFENYLNHVYRARAKLMPVDQRAELEQAFNAGVQFLLVQLGTNINRGAPRLVVREQMQEFQGELDAYSGARLAVLEMSNRLRVVRSEGQNVKS